jgi:Uma2 family endonuclease
MFQRKRSSESGKIKGARITSMSVASPPLFQTAESLPRKRFTRDEVEYLLNTGFFDGQRFELIDGELLDRMGQNPPHANAIRLTQRQLGALLDPSLIQVQLPIEVAAGDRERSLPEPDLAVLQEIKPDFDERHPRGDELLLVIEVADTTATFDLSRKVALYASAGVREYWVLDLPRRMLVVHRQPFGSAYRLIELFSEGDTVSLENRAETVRVSDLLPARS